MIFEDVLDESTSTLLLVLGNEVLDASTNVVYLGPLHHVRLEDMPKRGVFYVYVCTHIGNRGTCGICGTF